MADFCKRRSIRLFDKDFSMIPPFIDSRKMLIRGTLAWEAREAARMRAGCQLLSFGTIPKTKSWRTEQ